MVPGKNVAEEGLVGQQWEERGRWRGIYVEAKGRRRGWRSLGRGEIGKGFTIENVNEDDIH